MVDKKFLLKIAVCIIVLASVSIVSVLVFFGDFFPPAGAVRVACVGDSITEGLCYPEALQAMLGEEDYLVGNFGVGGSTVMVDSGKPYAEQDAFQEAKDFRPDIVVVMLGTNDARADNVPHLGNFTVEYEELINAFEELSCKPKVFIAKPPPMFNNTVGLNETVFVQNVLPEFNSLVANVNNPVIDVYSALIDHPDLFVDGVHPSFEGAQVIAQTVSEALFSE
jgi:lysophospholipase L1-like esterase